MKRVNMLIVAMLTLLTGISAQPATGSIKGKVTTADNKPAEGVTVLVKNTVKNTVADNSGNFEIKNISFLYRNWFSYELYGGTKTYNGYL